MTNRDEQRAACITAMYATLYAAMNGRWTNDPAPWVEAVTAAFDALHGIARVCTIEATEEMLQAALDNPETFGFVEAYKFMSAAGDLTNRPGEAK